MQQAKCFRILGLISLAAGGLVATIAFSPANAEESSGLPNNVLDPKTYRSRSGEFQVYVDPSHMNACYEADYKVTRDGVTLWARQLPFTLWEARICDDGYVVGYAYSQGIDGIFDRGDDARPGQMIVAIIDPTGQIVLQEEHDRKDSNFLHAHPSPIVAGLELGGLQQKFLLRVKNADLNERDQHWWCYEIRKGQKTGELRTDLSRSDGLNSRSILHVKAVPETELWLVQMWVYESDKIGTAFALCDSAGRVVWEIDALGDYEIADEKQRDELRDQIRRTGAILDSAHPRQFQLHFVKPSQIATFEVKAGGKNKWQVSEINRRPSVFVFGKASKFDAALVPRIDLPYLGQVNLQTNEPNQNHPVRAMACGFDMDGDGNFGFIRHEDERFEFVLVDPDGKLLHEFELNMELPKDFELNGIVSVGDGLFVTVASSWTVGSKALAWKIDVRQRSNQLLSDFESPEVECLAGMNDGRFVVLATEHSKYTMSSQLQICGPDGKRLKLIEQGYQAYPRKLFSPEAVTVNSNGEICVVDNIKKEVVFYGDDGRYRRKFDLRQRWGHEPNYPTGIAGTNTSGILVYDFDGRPALVQMSFGGKVTATFDPRPAEGRKTLYVGNELCVAPDGRIWLTEGPMIVRLDPSGLVDKRLGVPADLKTLGRIDAVHVDRRAGIYAQSGRTGAVHVFDSSGQLQRVVHHQRLLDQGYSGRSINVTEDRELIVCDGASSNAALLYFNERGDFVREVIPPADPVYYQPISRNLLCCDLTQLLVASQNGKRQHSIRRHADRSWLKHVDSVSVAPDGSFAVLARHMLWGDMSKVSVYKKDGTPMYTIELAHNAHSFDYDGNYLAVSTGKGVVLFSSEGVQLGLFAADELPVDAQWPQITMVNESSELVIVDEQRDYSIYRYDLTSLSTRASQ